MKSSTKFLTMVAAVIVIGAGLFWASHAGYIPLPGSAKPAAAADAASAAPPAVPVSVAAVIEKPVTEWSEFSGRIQAIDRVQIRPQVSGIIEAVHFDDGQMVKKGDPLFTIDPRPFQAALAQAQASLAGAQAKLAWTHTNLARSQELIQTHAIAQTQLDSDNDAVLEADAAVKLAQAAVQTAQINLDYTAITAPVAGRVSRAEITVGNFVGDGVNAPVLTTLVSVSPVYVEFEMDEQAFLKYASTGAAGNSNLDNIPVGMGLANEDGYAHTGRLQALDNVLDVTSGTIRVRAVFDNPNGELTPGLYAKVRTGSASAVPAILVDDRAIGTDQDKKYVMVVGADNHASYRAVTLGPIVDGLRVIRTGLQKDERIVVNGLQRVRPNALVAPTDVAMDRRVVPSDLAATSGK
jgi:membrane fusion protein, multidrug efflux system